MNLNPKIPGPYTMGIANGRELPGVWETAEEASAAAEAAMSDVSPGEVLIVYGCFVVPLGGLRKVAAGAALKT